MKVLDKLFDRFRPKLTCRDANAFIVEYLDNDLDEATRAHFRQHVDKCPRCTRFLDQYKSTIEMLNSDGRLEAPPELIENTLEYLRSRGVGRS